MPVVSEPAWVKNPVDAFLAEPLTAVLLCQSDPKVDVAMRVLESGRHLFLEKPVAFVADDVDRMAAAAQAAAVVAQAGYMKVYDPAFRLVEREVDGMRDLRFVQVNHLHTDNRHHLTNFRLRAADDLPASARDDLGARRRADCERALGVVSEDVRSAFFHLAGSMIHDLYGLRHLFGPPDRVASIMGHTPMNRFGAAGELVGATLLLASDRAGGFITGAEIIVDGGYASMTI